MTRVGFPETEKPIVLACDFPLASRPKTIQAHPNYFLMRWLNCYIRTTLDAAVEVNNSMGVEENLRLMQTLDDAWNAKDWETFKKRHAENVAVYWPGQPEPTRGRYEHHKEALGFFQAFDNRLDNNPYKILFGYGDYTCSVARWTGTNIGPFMGPDGRMIPATNKKFELEFCTVAHWKNGEIVEEKLFYDLMGLLKQLGITLTAKTQAEQVPAV